MKQQPIEELEHDPAQWSEEEYDAETPHGGEHAMVDSTNTHSEQQQHQKIDFYKDHTMKNSNGDQISEPPIKTYPVQDKQASYMQVSLMTLQQSSGTRHQPGSTSKTCISSCHCSRPFEVDSNEFQKDLERVEHRLHGQARQLTFVNNLRPGTSGLVNKQRYFEPTEHQFADTKRHHELLKLFNCIKEIEEEKSFKNLNPYPNFLEIKPIEKHQLLHNAPPTNSYSRSYHIEGTELLYKILRGDTKLVRSLLEGNSFSHTESHEWNVLWASSSCKSYLYEGLNEYQKINHFPNSYEITRKDRLCYNYVKLQQKFGRGHFDFIPDSYILPNEYGDFYAHFQNNKKEDPKRNTWIVKPANSSRGRGIYITDNINEISVDELSVVCKYIANPLLINGHKFDLRIYVVVTCYEPLRVYIFQEGLARFASEVYSNKVNKQNQFSHLTNYSINKNNENFVQNSNQDQDDVGFKWSLTAFCQHLENVGIDMSLVWSRTYDLIIKTLITGEHHVMQGLRKNCNYRTNCFEIFGFDILIDSDLKPWLMEVNLSPSLATDSPIDMIIKTTLLSDTFNLMGVKRFDRKKESMNKLKNRIKNKSQKNGTMKPGSGYGEPLREVYNQNTSPQTLQQLERLVAQNPNEFGPIHDTLVKCASVKFRELIHETLSEFSRMSDNFIRIYPAKGSCYYDQFFSGHRAYNRLIYKVLYTDEILKRDISLPMAIQPIVERQQVKEVSESAREKRPVFSKFKEETKEPSTAMSTSSYGRPQTAHPTAGSTAPSQSARIAQIQKQERPTTACPESKEKQKASDKVLITGDDILIEYVDRLMQSLEKCNESIIDQTQCEKLESFINHYVWHHKSERHINGGIVSYGNRLKQRLTEMQERRRRLIKYMFKKEEKMDQFEEGFAECISKKTNIIKKFTSPHLEDLLRTSTKNVAHEVVSCLIDSDGPSGILSFMETITGAPAKSGRSDRDSSGIASQVPQSQMRASKSTSQSRANEGYRYGQPKFQQNNYFA